MRKLPEESAVEPVEIESDVSFDPPLKLHVSTNVPYAPFPSRLTVA